MTLLTDPRVRLGAGAAALLVTALAIDAAVTVLSARLQMLDH